MLGRYICHLCCGRQTDSILTLAGQITGPCLPVCIVCIPPWINDTTHKWWYEIISMYNSQDQKRPTMEEINILFSLRKSLMTCYQRDDELYTKCLEKNYKTRWAIDELQSHWNEEKLTYEW